MHINSYELMVRLLSDHIVKSKVYPDDYPMRVIDVGSMDVRGTGSYRNMFSFEGIQKYWTYTGLDISAGDNVDIVASDPYNWPVADGSFDVVISGQCLEHVEAPWLWVKEVERICAAGGFAFVIAPYEIKVHRFPVDCYRYLPDGMAYLFGKYCNFGILETDISNGMDTFVAARKKPWTTMT